MRAKYVNVGQAVGVLAGLLAFAPLPDSAQPKQATVLDGAYTEAQAQTGAVAYEVSCAGCHEGDEPEANSPKGSEFIERWREAPLGFLYQFISTNMPGNKPGSLTEENYLDIVSYLLKANGYPAGVSELTVAKTSSVLLVGTDGPKPLPANALVRAVGCLAPTGNEWTLTKATNPDRVRTADQTTPQEVAASAAMPPGLASYKLTNAEEFSAPKLKGQRVQAKGVLTQVTNPYSLTVLSLERAGNGCGN
jgi:S-disulfanyl-L-cysteine oxidoreductase SoxD